MILVKTVVRQSPNDCDWPARIDIDERFQIIALVIVLLEWNHQAGIALAQLTDIPVTGQEERKD